MAVHDKKTQAYTDKVFFIRRERDQRYLIEYSKDLDVTVQVFFFIALFNNSVLRSASIF